MICSICKGAKTNPNFPDQMCSACKGVGEVTVKRGDNVGSVKTLVGAVNSVDEMEAFEELGPLTRDVIVNGPLKFLATPIVNDIRAFEQEQRQKLPEHARHLYVLDLKNPRIDRGIAEGLLKDNLMVMMRDRDQEDAKAGLVPLRPKRARTGRRTYR